MGISDTPLNEAPAGATVTIRAISSIELERRLPNLAQLLIDTVADGISLGFLPPLRRKEACSYWLSLRSEINAGARLLLGVYSCDRIIGVGQLAIPSWPSATHRAELQKIFVASSVRGGGIGRRLMTALHDAARQRGRSLLTLGTRRGGGAEDFYKSLGYREAGMVPGYSVGPTGERYDSVTLYHELAP
jgi:GNAT superfamily N-acetyltransferase